MSTSSDDRSPMAATVGIGIALEVLAGAMLSLSLVIQRHAQIHQRPRCDAEAEHDDLAQT